MSYALMAITRTFRQNHPNTTDAVFYVQPPSPGLGHGNLVTDSLYAARLPQSNQQPARLPNGLA